MAEATDSGGRSARARVARALGWMTLGALATLALLLGAALLALPALEHRPGVVAGWLGEQLGREVQLRELEVAWSGGAPLVRLRGLTVAGRASRDRLSLETAEVRVDPIASLRAGQLRPSGVTVRGASLHVERSADGGYLIAGLGAERRADAGAVVAGTLSTVPDDVEFALEQTRVTITNLPPPWPSGSDATLDDVSLRLRALPGAVRLSGTAALPGASATPLRFTLHWPRGEGVGVLERADLTLSTRALPLAALPPALRPAGLDGRLTLDVDGSVLDQRVERLRGTLRIEDAALGESERVVRFDAVESLLDFERTAHGWQTTLLRLRAISANGAWPTTTLAIAGGDARAGFRYRARLDHAPLAGILPLLDAATLPDPLRRWVLPALRPVGSVEDLEIELAHGARTLRDARLAARLHGVAVRTLPGGVELVHADGTIVAMASGGVVELAGARLVPPGLSGPSQPAPRDLRASGHLRWHLADGALVLDSDGLEIHDGSNALRLRGRLDYPTDAGGERAPHADVELTASEIDTEALRPYLGAGLLPAPLSGWLHDNVRNGRLTDVRGRVDSAFRSLADLVAAHELTLRFEEVDVHPAPGWPALEKLAGTLHVDGDEATFETTDGRVSGARIEALSGGVDAIGRDEATLRMRGSMSGRTEQGAAFLAATPLAPRFADLLAQLDARGPARVTLDLAVPMHGRPARVDGTLELSDNTLRVPALRSAMEDVSGSIGFDRLGPSRGTLRARYLGRRIDATLGGNADVVRLSIDGSTDPRGLLRHLYDVGAVDADDPKALPMLSRLAGETPWTVRLDIPRHDAGTRGIGLAVESGLAGMEVRLPAPLGKPASPRQALRVDTTLATRGPRRFRVRYGQTLDALIEVEPHDGDFRLSRGALRFGGGEAELADGDGLVVGGRIESLSVDAWVATLARLEGGARDDRPQPLAALRAVDVRVARLDVLGAGFDAVRLGAAREPGPAWHIAIRGAGIDGDVVIPEPIGRAPVEAAFERLRVHREAATLTPAGRLDVDPASLPEANVVAKSLHYNDIDLGIAKLALTRDGGGLAIREMYALSDSFEVRGSGRWLRDAGGAARTDLDLRIHTNDVGRMFSALGYGDSGVEGGATEIAMQVHWPGAPHEFDLAGTLGTLHFRTGAGRLRDLEPGTTGRVFGLLSLPLLPRRLLGLDFSDLVEEGTAYERIEGSFNLEAGSAYTTNLSMLTETATVDVVGRIGLVAQDYDQIVTVTPKLSSSLPLAPLWLAEKFLQRKLIDSAFAYRYIITGTWDDPKIERVRVKGERSEAG